MSPVMKASRVNGLAYTLDAVEVALTRYVHFTTEEQAWAVTLWAALSYIPERSDVSPRLAIKAPTRQSGKTRTLEVLVELCRDSWYVVGPSAAVLYRFIGSKHPTVLLDEADRFFEQRAEDQAAVLQVINAGHARGAVVPRMEGVGTAQKVHNFDVFGPLALAGIGTQWPDTVLDRAVVITLQRKTASEPVARLRRDGKAALRALADQLGKAVKTAVTGELTMDDLPDALSDRQQDSWEPLLAIAQLAGGSWPDKALRAALALSSGATIAIEDDRDDLQALRDVRSAFAQSSDVPYLASTDVVNLMRAMEESPWRDRPGRDGLSVYGLSGLLRPFGVRPGQRVRGGPRGYALADVQGAWARVGQGIEVSTASDASTYAGVETGD